jgi:hypothetical protein
MTMTVLSVLAWRGGMRAHWHVLSRKMTCDAKRYGQSSSACRLNNRNFENAITLCKTVASACQLNNRHMLTIYRIF